MGTYSKQQLATMTGWDPKTRFMPIHIEGQHPELTNETRAEWAQLALQAFAHATNQVKSNETLVANDDDQAPLDDVFDEVLGDFLCDLMHLIGCERFFAVAEVRAHANYHEELEEAAAPVHETIEPAEKYL